jgi:hypothetical protein
VQTISPETTKVQKPKHAGGKDDIQAIGNRKIGERGLGNWYSLESEIGIGREYSQAVESSVIPLVFVGGGVGPGHKVIACHAPAHIEPL